LGGGTRVGKQIFRCARMTNAGLYLARSFGVGTQAEACATGRSATRARGLVFGVEEFYG
jgi:hypothetical protein